MWRFSKNKFSLPHYYIPKKKKLLILIYLTHNHGLRYIFNRTHNNRISLEIESAQFVCNDLLLNQIDHIHYINLLTDN